MKSSDRLFSTVSSRAVRSSTATPIANAEPLRELLEPCTPAPRSCTCLCGRPAVPTGAAPSHSSYSTACRPTPPAAACTIIVLPACCVARSSAACTVLQVVGTVHACSADIANGFGARKREAERAKDASGARTAPNAAMGAA
eukprot:6832020-Prymnesium_polylepis.2